jgi:phosphoserine phosphatase
MNIYLVQTGQTTWEADRRVEPPTGSPLTEAGLQAANLAACELSAEDVQAIYAGDAEAEEQTARLIVEHVKAKVHLRPELRDVDFGLWQGLTHDDLKRRHPKVYKQWQDSPASVCPPGGETISDVASRLAEALRTIDKKHKGEPVAIVARPMVVAMLRCLLTGASLDELPANIDPTFTWQHFEAEGDAVA